MKLSQKLEGVVVIILMVTMVAGVGCWIAGEVMAESQYPNTSPLTQLIDGTVSDLSLIGLKVVGSVYALCFLSIILVRCLWGRRSAQ